MGKNTKVMPQYPAIYLLSCKREGILTSQTLYKANYQVRFLTFPPACNDLDKASTIHLKIAQKYIYFFTQILHLSSNRREQNLAHLFQFMIPARKVTHNMKFEHFWMQKDMNFGNIIIICHFGPENHQNPTQKDTNFGNTTIIHHFGPENHQNPT